MSLEGFVIENDTLIRYEGNEVEVLEIPEGVVTVANKAFDASRESMRRCKKITFPASVKVLGEYLFCFNDDNCFDALEEIVFMGDIDIIGKDAFRTSCDFYYMDEYFVDKLGLKRVKFEGHVKEIAEGAFSGTKITSVCAPNGIDKLGGWVFNACVNLEEVIIPGLQSMGEECFNQCKKLTRLEIPSTCTVSKGTFNGCMGLGNADGQFVYNGVLFSARYNTRDSWDNREWASIPDGVLKIDNYAISAGDTFVVPTSVKTIDDQGYIDPEIDLAENFFETDQKLTGKGFLRFLERRWIESISAKDWAYLYLYQTGKTIEKLLKKNKRDINAIVEGMIEAIEKYGKERNCVKAVEFVVGSEDEVSIENIQKLYDVLVSKKSNNTASLLEPYIVRTH